MAGTSGVADRVGTGGGGVIVGCGLVAEVVLDVEHPFKSSTAVIAAIISGLIPAPGSWIWAIIEAGNGFHTPRRRGFRTILSGPEARWLAYSAQYPISKAEH